MASSMLIEDTLESKGSLLHELFPLSLEELEAFTLDDIGVLSLEVSHGSDTLLESWVVEFSSDSDFDLFAFRNTNCFHNCLSLIDLTFNLCDLICFKSNNQ